MKDTFIKYNLKTLKYKTKQEMIEKLYLKSIIDSYDRISKTVDIENSIRDRFVKDLYKNESPLKKWIDVKFIRVQWENWVFSEDEDDLGRIDLIFQSIGSDFIIECKRLKMIDKKYFTQGLKRFIELKYAKGEEYAAMLGFVVSGDQKRICTGLEIMSNKYNPISNDFTTTPFILWNPNFKSAHERNDFTVIGIYHLFFDFSSSVLDSFTAN